MDELVTGSLCSVSLANGVTFWSVTDNTKSPDIRCFLAHWTIWSPWHLVRMKQTTEARAERNHKQHTTNRAQGPSPCQWGRLERQAWLERLLTINSFTENGLDLATLRQTQSILSASPGCVLLGITMAWIVSGITRQPKLNRWHSPGMESGPHHLHGFYGSIPTLKVRRGEQGLEDLRYLRHLYYFT